MNSTTPDPSNEKLDLNERSLEMKLSKKERSNEEMEKTSTTSNPSPKEERTPLPMKEWYLPQVTAASVETLMGALNPKPLSAKDVSDAIKREQFKAAFTAYIAARSERRKRG